MSVIPSNVLLITANVGSLFEDPDNKMNLWLGELFKTIKSKSPQFIAIHCQEVGGKNCEQSIQYVDPFIKSLLNSDVLQSYTRYRIYLDEDFTLDEQFTALGNIYFIHDSVSHVQIWDFQSKKYCTVEDNEIFAGSLDDVSCKEKVKFDLPFFPDGRWSRKGYMRTRWCLNHVQFDLVNIHLFHDANNLISIEKNPSMYAEYRYNALRWIISRFRTDCYEKVPYFIFGDFNFRLAIQGLTNYLSQSSSPLRSMNKKNALNSLVYKHPANGCALTIEKKLFDFKEKHADFFENKGNWLRQFEVESTRFSDSFKEFEFNFPPSYPFSEEVSEPTSYMKTRCPSWCDRIFASHSVLSDILAPGCKPDYNMIGRSVCMGDHKPVYLHITLRPKLGNNAGEMI